MFTFTFTLPLPNVPHSTNISDAQLAGTEIGRVKCLWDVLENVRGMNHRSV